MKIKWTSILGLKKRILGHINAWGMQRWSALYKSGYEYAWSLYDEGWNVDDLLGLVGDSDRPFDAGVEAGLVDILRYEREQLK